MSEKYPAWIDEYAQSMHNAFLHMVPSNWAPDGFSVLKFLNGTFIDKLAEGVQVLKAKGVPLEEVARCFPSASTLRCHLLYFFIEYQHATHKDKAKMRETAEYLMDVARVRVHDDFWIHHSNIAHSAEEVAGLLAEVPWQTGTPEAAQELGRVYNSALSLAYALYGDFFPQDTCDVYGPYDASKKFGEGAILVIKHFGKLVPEGLWPTLTNDRYKDVKIFQIYKGVTFSCEFVGMHSLYEGDTRGGTVAYAVSANGEFLDSVEKIKDVRDYLAGVAQEQAKTRDAMTKQDIQAKFAEWLCYQFNKFFELAGMDWRPTPEMKKALEGKEIPDRLIIESMPPYEEFVNSPEWEVYWIKEAYVR